MKKLLVILLCFCIFYSGNTQNLQRPKLVVGIVVDQMRWDYLFRYYDRYEEGGFKRLLNEGFSANNTFISHLPSYTAVGHATVFTGSVPAIHGITGNNWIDQVSGKKIYCTDDSTVKGVGSDSKAGPMSPRNLLVTTITDELRLATNFRSKVIGVSLKDRASIIPAGHTANAAFWFDDSTGNFITSTYYMNDLPSWVKKFNNQKLPEKLVANDWSTLYPITTYTQSTEDNVPWEDTSKGEKAPVFPHKVSQFYKADKGKIRTSPFGNTLTLSMAKAAVEGENLGEGNFTDFLTVNLASTDYVGHAYGPNSIEVEDTYLRLDKDFAAFFSFLDKRLGKGQYTVFLTADHAAAHAIDFMKEHKLPGDFFKASPLNKLLMEHMKEKYGVDSLLKEDLNYHIAVNKELINKLQLNYNEVKKEAVHMLEKQPGVEFAVDIENLGNSPIPEPIKSMIANGYNPKRAGALIIIPESGWFTSNGRGTTHGSWSPYDTHIPLLFMGWGVMHGSTSVTYHMTDIAPTIASLLHIQMPSGCVGKVIQEVQGGKK